MPIQILMPALSPTMTEGNLLRWLKNEGDTVKSGEILAEIETDKATMEMEAVDDGVMGKILVPAGTENVKVNALVALMLEKGEDPKALEGFKPTEVVAPAPVAAAPAVEKSATPAPTPATSSAERVFASPLARRVAKERGINLAQIKGSGPHGRIVEADVKTTQLRTGEAPYREVALNNMRKVIAKRLTEAKRDIPHFYLTIDCQLDDLLKLRTKMNTRLNEKLSVNDFIVRACALSLIAVPEANATWHDTAIRQYQNADVAVAVAIDGGLVTPVVTQAEAKTISQISAEVRELAARARAGKLKPEEYQGGTFTLSNLGMYGIKNFAAILNPPQACILAVGMGEKRPVVQEDGTLGIATLMTCTLSVDHRTADGAVGARFLAAFKELIEDPLGLVL